MTLNVKAQDMLHEGLAASRLFADWLKGDLQAEFLEPGQQEAGRELERALQPHRQDRNDAAGQAPLFCSGWASAYEESVAEDQGAHAERDLLLTQLQALRTGDADVVVTGQQPGYLGGPLYTLYKVAPTIALARQRTALGRPTVPVFWSGDDDSDLAEALDPVAWAPATGGIHSGPAASVGAFHSTDQPGAVAVPTSRPRT